MADATLDVHLTVVSDAQPMSPAMTVVHAERSGLINLQELWTYRELLYFLMWRDVKVRYKQTALGVIWALVQPLSTMVVFSLFLGRAAGIASGDLPYPLFVLAGLLPWTFFSTTIIASGQSVVGSQNLITKVYFPRLLIPIGTVGAGLLDFAIGFGMLAVMMLFYSVRPDWGGLAIPAIMIGVMSAAVGVGSLLAALTVAYRDFRYVVGFLAQLWMFATPSIYMDAEKVPASWQVFLALNPLHGLIEGFRSALFGREIDAAGLAISTSVSVALLVSGTMYFRRTERHFADVI